MIRGARCMRRAVARPRGFATSAARREVRRLDELPPRRHPRYTETSHHDLLALQWPAPPRNVLFVRKDDAPPVRDALVEYARHVQATYPGAHLVFEPDVARQVHSALRRPVYTIDAAPGSAPYPDKVDLVTTLGGDGTILHAASLFATARTVPPVLSFSMGTLGFLGEWKFAEYKRAFREVFVSGAPAPLSARPRAESGVAGAGADGDAAAAPIGDGGAGPRRLGGGGGWSDLRGKSMGATRTSRVLMRSRLRIGLFDADGVRLPHAPPFVQSHHPYDDIFALNEVLLHRGSAPHLAHITILIGSPPHQRTLTTAIGDGFLISTPTGSTAYSLSSGGSIVHPLVKSLLLTPICPRSLSFRPLVLPANTPITLRIAESNRGKEIAVSVDGVRRQQGLRAGMEVRVVGEGVRTSGGRDVRDWRGGVPSIVRSGAAADGDDHWVGGLNSLLKFNYPFGGTG